MKLINPYTEFGTKHKASLDYVIANLPVNPTFENLNEQLVNSFFIPNPNEPGPLDLVPPVLRTVLPSAYNAYGGTRDEGRGTKGNSKFTEQQLTLVSQLIDGMKTVPALSIGDYLSNAEESVISAGLSFEEQTPLLLALAIGKADNEYWLNQITVIAAWGNYLNADSALNYANLSGWVAASMQGALLTYGLIKPPQILFADVYVSTLASTGLVSGKVIWGWLGK